MTDDDSSSQTLSILLDETQSDAERLERLLPLVYGQLRAVAERAWPLIVIVATLLLLRP